MMNNLIVVSMGNQSPIFRPLDSGLRRIVRWDCFGRFSFATSSVLRLREANSSSAYGLRTVILTKRASSSRYAFSAAREHSSGGSFLSMPYLTRKAGLM